MRQGNGLIVVINYLNKFMKRVIEPETEGFKPVLYPDAWADQRNRQGG